MTTAARATISTVGASKRFENKRESVRCGRCELRQYRAELCRRCKAPLPKPLVHLVVTEFPVSAETDERLFGPGVLVVSLAQLEQNAIARALMEADDAIEAAAGRLDKKKTVLYQKVAEIFGREANALRRMLARASEEEVRDARYARYVSIREGRGSR